MTDDGGDRVLMKNMQASESNELGIFLNAASIRSISEFKRWTRDTVRAIFPHQSLAVGCGRIHGLGVNIDAVVSVDCPVEYLMSIRNSAGVIDSPILRRWLATKEPQLFEADFPWGDIPKNWFEQFKKNGLRNAAAHAVYDTERCLASYFSFHGIPSRLDNTHIQALKLLVPVMHEILLRVLHDRSGIARFEMIGVTLTERELEVLKYVRHGKTNREISQAICLSEITVKHHLANIFSKLGVQNRAQLVARAVEYLVRIRHESAHEFL